MTPSLVLVAMALSLQIQYAEAKGYRNGYRPPSRTQEELQYNHQPLELLAPEELPKHWNWCDVDGPDLCTPSWNQHEPVCKAFPGICQSAGFLSCNLQYSVAPRISPAFVLLVMCTGYASLAVLTLQSR